MRRIRLRCLMGIGLVIGLAACTPPSPAVPTLTPTATATLTATASPTPTATPSPTPSATATSTPTPTATPSATATPTPTATPSATPTPTATPTAPPPTRPPATLPPSPTPPEAVAPSELAPHLAQQTLPSPTPAHWLMAPPAPNTALYPTLADFWEGTAQFVLDVLNTGLPMGESDTLVMGNGELWAYLHTSTGVSSIVDRCGDAVPFPGCTVIYRSRDGGRTFYGESPLTCQFDCITCPCEAERDHINQQQYPRLAYNGATLFLVYEYLGRTRLRRSTDGLTWTPPEKVADTGIWKLWLRNCSATERIRPHPYVPYEYECLSGGPPGIFTTGGRVYVFVGMGQNPGSMGCYVGAATTSAEQFVRCRHNPLFVGAPEYGPPEEKGPQTNPYFDFRTISSAEVQQIGDRFYMLYEGVRGPGPGDAGDTQFGLGLARSRADQIDDAWETYPHNPILVDMPGNIGLGHADLIVWQGQTVLFTSLDGVTRSRLVLVWQ